MSKRKSFKHIINHKNTSSNGHGKLILLSVDCWSYFWWDAWRCVVTLHSYKFSIPEKCWILRFFGNVTPFRMFKRQIIYKYVGYGYRISYDILNKCWAKKVCHSESFGLFGHSNWLSWATPRRFAQGKDWFQGPMFVIANMVEQCWT